MKETPYPNFLVIGMERSGTHWIAALLNNHPEIACFPSLPFYTEAGRNNVGEVHFFNTLAGLDGSVGERDTRSFEDFLTKYNKVFADLVPYKDKVSRAELYEMFCKRYSDYCNRERGGKKIVGESTPAYVFHLDFIDTLYPGIKKIASIRDPKDKIVSWHFNMIRKNRKPADEPITEEFALGYLRKRIIPEYEALLLYDGDAHVITYERMHKNTKEVARGMVEYLCMKATDEILSHMETESAFERQTAKDSASHIPRNPGEEDISSGLRKGIVGDWKGNMDDALATTIDGEVAEIRKKVFDRYHVLEE